MEEVSAREILLEVLLKFWPKIQAKNLSFSPTFASTIETLLFGPAKWSQLLERTLESLSVGQSV